MAKDDHKKCVFTALLIFWANCVSFPPSLLMTAAKQTKRVQSLIYLTALHFVFFQFRPNLVVVVEPKHADIIENFAIYAKYPSGV